VELAAGESREVSFTLGPDELGYYGPEGKWVVEPGRFRVWVGESSDCDLSVDFEVQ
jgi:beta-glucosidase